MTVVRNEFERGRNNPFELLERGGNDASLEKHPYRIPTIGSKGRYRKFDNDKAA